MIGRKSVILSVSVIAILVLSTLFAAIPITPRVSAQAQQLPREQRNWEFTNYDSRGTNSNPQTQINKDNVKYLELKWLFPWPGAQTRAAQLNGYFVLESSITPPLVVDGVVYVAQQDLTLRGFDAKTGKLLMSASVTSNLIEEAKRLPNIRPQLPGESVAGAGVHTHIHGINYQKGLIWMNTLACSFAGFDAFTGKLKLQVKDVCLDVPGTPREGIYPAASYGSNPPTIWEAGNIAIWSLASVMDGASSGRAFVAGFDITTGKMVWRTFLEPPFGLNSDPEWALRECAKGWFAIDNDPKEKTPYAGGGIRCTDVPRENLLNDWLYEEKPGVFRKPRGNGQGAIWGQFTVDQETGIAYFGTGNVANDYNATYRPGPNLYSTTTMAVDMRDGKIVWWFKEFNDFWDYDCSWNQPLGKIGDRKVIFKGCKRGVIWALDAKTGEPIWWFTPPNIKWENVYFSDMRIKEEVRERWRNEKLYPTGGPMWTNGFSLEGDINFDGKTVYTWASQSAGYRRVITADPYDVVRINFGSQVTIPNPPGAAQRNPNATVYALDAATGKVKWSYFIDNVFMRGGMLVSGGVVYVPGAGTGKLIMLDADTGKLIHEINLGIGLYVQPTIGADADGKMKLFLLYGKQGAGSPSLYYPGALLVYGLPDKLPEPQVITKEVIKEVPKEVIKEVPKEVVKEVVKEVPKEVIKEVPKEVIKEVPKEVVRTETKTVTVETISPISYAAIGIGVVLVVVAGVIFTRRKKA